MCSSDLMQPVIEEDFKKKCSPDVFQELNNLILKQHEEKYAPIYYAKNMKKIKRLIIPNTNTKELIEFIDSLIPDKFKLPSTITEQVVQQEKEYINS